MHALGHITAFYENIRTGRLTKALEQKNLILFEGADIMAAILGGDMSKAISHMYFQYENTNVGPVSTPILTRGSGRSSFDAITGVDPASDWLRVPLLSTPKLVRIPNDSADYAQNGVVFTATSAASETMHGESPAHNYFAASGANGPSKIVSAALVAAPAPSNNRLDKVFSRVNLSTPLTMQPGHQLTVYWIINFH